MSHEKKAKGNGIKEELVNKGMESPPLILACADDHQIYLDCFISVLFS